MNPTEWLDAKAEEEPLFKAFGVQNRMIIDCRVGQTKQC